MHEERHQIKFLNEHLKYVSNDILQLIILPTEQCNFRCLYCYEKFDHGLIRQEVVEGLKNLLLARKKELKKLSVSWFGGEPLLAYHKIIEILDFIHENVIQNGRPNFVSEMTTNGYLLTIERFKTLAERGVKFYQITFDGDEDKHDKLRIKSDGTPTFSRIFQNIINAHNTDLEFEIMIRIHVNVENASSIQSLLIKLSKFLASDKRFRIFLRPLSRLGGKNDDILPILCDERIIQQLNNVAKNLGLYIAEKQNTWNEVCYASRLNSFIIRADGRISKCTVALYDERNLVGKLNRDGTITLDTKKIYWWSRGLFSGNKETLACPLRV